MRVAAAARSGTAKRDKLTGSTITVTSLGTHGGIAATSIINYPETAITGSPMVRACAVNLSSSFDHRIVDGYEAASFVGETKTTREHPALIFVPLPR